MIAVLAVVALGVASCSTAADPVPPAADAERTAPAEPQPTAPSTTPTRPVSTSAASTAPPTTSAPSTTALSPVEDEFFDAAGVAPGNPGEVIRTRPFDLGDPNLQGWQVLVWSRDVRDEPVAVSGVVVAPAAPPTAPRPVLSWAHGTTGMGDQCAPSRAWASGRASERAFLPLLQQGGWVFAATDYQGLGTPGDHTYVVGQAEGRNVLDLARAAQRLDGTGATADSPVLAWGHSQGGGAALFAAELAPTYAPELDVIGAIAGAPAAELGTLDSSFDAGPYAGFQVMATIGFVAAYPHLAGDDRPSAEAQAIVDEVRGACVGDILEQLSGRSVAELVPSTADQQAELAEVLEANTAGHTPTPVPIFVYHGDDDEVIPVATSARLLDRYCALGVPVQRTTYPGADHVSVIAAALGDILGFATARVAGDPAPSSCP